MRMDARDAARLLLAFAPFLLPNAHLLTTLKLPERGYLPVLDKAFEILAEGYRRVAARQLYHNRSEVTVLLQRRVP
jgi:23S rRNA (cytidine2498-2'-O)-methyltransferase